MATARRRSTESGIAILFSPMLIFVIGCVGLAVDVGAIYMIKSRLSALQLFVMPNVDPVCAGRESTVGPQRESIAARAGKFAVTRLGDPSVNGTIAFKANGFPVFTIC